MNESIRRKEYILNQNASSEVLKGKTSVSRDEISQYASMDRNDNNVGVGNSGNPPNSSTTTHGILHNTSGGTNDVQVRTNKILLKQNCTLRVISSNFERIKK